MLWAVCPPDVPEPGFRPTRRGLIAGATALTVAAIAGAGCSSQPEPGPTGTPTSDAPPDPDAVAVLAALTSERSLIQAYDTAIGRIPDLEPLLREVRQQHVDHAEALRGLAAVTEPTTVPAINIPGAPAGALAALRTAEQDAAVDRTNQCVTAQGFECARTLALIAASEASHSAVLADRAAR